MRPVKPRRHHTQKLAGARWFPAEPPYNYQPACKPGFVWHAA